ncbi:tubulin-folding cofactor B-like [Bolinopsis microptera]|uniref:tubulin-folding cofactor B-like n=1 Tax=Bolinopsis microptera TaxID=2820187 RepID=UPI00307A9F73
MAAIVTNPDFLKLSITSAVSPMATEKRFPSHITVRELKGKLEMITGASMNSMKIEIFNDLNKSIGKLTDDDAILKNVLPSDVRLHITDPTAANFQDTSAVEKYELSKEEYDQKEDTVQAFKKRNKLGRFNPEVQAKLAAQSEENKERASKMNIGDRCEARTPKQPPRRGQVMFVGEVEFKDGHWVGIKFDEPVGKHDGVVEGKRYFKCENKYGAFLQPRMVEVGDFPPEMDFSDDEI